MRCHGNIEKNVIYICDWIRDIKNINDIMYLIYVAFLLELYLLV